MKHKNKNFKIENEAILVPKGVHKNQKNNQVIITFSSPSGTIYQFELPEQEMIGLKKDATVSLIFSSVCLAESLSKKQSKELFSFLHQNLKTT